MKTAIITVVVILICGCFAGGANPRKNAHEAIIKNGTEEFASRVINCNILTNDEIDKLVNMGVNGNQDVVYYILANKNVGIDVQLRLIIQVDGWGLQGIGYNDALYFNHMVVEIMKSKTNRMSADVYRILWIEYKEKYPAKL